MRIPSQEAIDYAFRTVKYDPVHITLRADYGSFADIFQSFEFRGNQADFVDFVREFNRLAPGRAFVEWHHAEQWARYYAHANREWGERWKTFLYGQRYPRNYLGRGGGLGKWSVFYWRDMDTWPRWGLPGFKTGPGPFAPVAPGEAVDPAEAYRLARATPPKPRILASTRAGFWWSEQQQFEPAKSEFAELTICGNVPPDYETEGEGIMGQISLDKSLYYHKLYFLCSTRFSVERDFRIALRFSADGNPVSESVENWNFLSVSPWRTDFCHARHGAFGFFDRSALEHDEIMLKYTITGTTISRSLPAQVFVCHADKLLVDVVKARNTIADTLAHYRVYVAVHSANRPF